MSLFLAQEQLVASAEVVVESVRCRSCWRYSSRRGVVLLFWPKDCDWTRCDRNRTMRRYLPPRRGRISPKSTRMYSHLDVNVCVYRQTVHSRGSPWRTDCCRSLASWCFRSGRGEDFVFSYKGDRKDTMSLAASCCLIWGGRDSCLSWDHFAGGLLNWDIFRVVQYNCRNDSYLICGDGDEFCLSEYERGRRVFVQISYVGDLVAANDPDTRDILVHGRQEHL